MACNINEEIGCTRCKHADELGRKCSYGDLFPVGILMAGIPCPNKENKTNDQLKEDLKWEK